jgi:hypothetical protein
MNDEHGGGGGRCPTVRADPDLLGATATRMLDIRLAADERCRPVLAELEIAEAAYGDLSGAAALGDAHRRARADAAATLEALGEAVEADVDRLLRVGFTQREADLAAQRRTMAAAAPGPPATVAPTVEGRVPPTVAGR